MSDKPSETYGGFTSEVTEAEEIEKDSSTESVVPVAKPKKSELDDSDDDDDDDDDKDPETEQLFPWSNELEEDETRADFTIQDENAEAEQNLLPDIADSEFDAIELEFSKLWGEYPPQVTLDEILADVSPMITSDSQSIDIGKIEVRNEKQAKRVAEAVISVLEEDLMRFFDQKGIMLYSDNTVVDEKEVEQVRIKWSGCSIDAIPPVGPEGEASTLDLFYEVGENLNKSKKLKPLTAGVDEEEDAILHRHKCRPDPIKIKKKDIFSQTKDMTFVQGTKAQHIFQQLYPRADGDLAKQDSKPYRRKSVESRLEIAAREDPLVDRVRQGPHITKFANRKKILPPLREDYYKVEHFWTGSKFQGEYKNRQFYRGVYDHPTGAQFESEWKDGHFHTEKYTGIVEYPRGDKFEGTWAKGRYIDGEVTFGDGLKYSKRNWKYLEAPDRRLHSEKYGPAGSTVSNDQFMNFNLPPGWYDVGEGVYNPKTAEVRGFDGFLIRIVDQAEHHWIIQHCRKQLLPEEQYIPCFHPDRIPGTYIEHQKMNFAKEKFP